MVVLSSFRRTKTARFCIRWTMHIAYVAFSVLHELTTVRSSDFVRKRNPYAMCIVTVMQNGGFCAPERERTTIIPYLYGKLEEKLGLILGQNRAFATDDTYLNNNYDEGCAECLTSFYIISRVSSVGTLTSLALLSNFSRPLFFRGRQGISFKISPSLPA